jgi:iron(III) transport system substrate-binding protein
MEASAIMSTTKEADAAKKLLDWSLTPEANTLYAQNFAIVAFPGIQEKLTYIPGDVEKMLGKNDFAWSAANRERILAEWIKRYDGKSEKK